MSNLEEKLKEKNIVEFLGEDREEISRWELKELGFSDYDIKKLVEENRIEKVGRGCYQTVKRKREERIEVKSGFDAVKDAFEQKDISALYKSFQNLDLNEDMIRSLYPLLLSGFITLQKEVETLKNMSIVRTKKEEVTEKFEKEEITEEIKENIVEEQITVVEEEDFMEPQEIIEVEEIYTYEEAEETYQAYLDAVNYKDYENAREYLLTYIKQSEQLGICDDRYYRLFRLDKKIYRDNYPRDTLQERYMLENQFNQFLKTKQLERAEECYQKLLTFDKKKNPYYDFFLYDLLHAKEEARSNAHLEVSERLRDNFPTYPKAHYKLAYAHFLRGNYDQAIKTLKKYFQYDLGEHCKGDNLLVICYLILGQYEKAEETVINAEKYLKPEILGLFYRNVAKSKTVHMNYLTKKINTSPIPLAIKYREIYEVFDTVLEKIEGMAQVDYMKDYIESDEKLPYFYALEDVWSTNHSTNEVNLYIDSLGLEDCDKMSMKLIAAEFFAQEKLYDASKKYLTEVECYKEKDAPLKEQFENTQKQIRLIKMKNK